MSHLVRVACVLVGIALVWGVFQTGTIGQSSVALAVGPTNVSGIQSGTWTLANSPYVVTGAVTVLAGQTLTIEPGVQVRFQTGTWIDIYGTLSATGTVGSPIAFTSDNGSPQKGDWYYVRFLAGSSGNLEQCSVRYGGRFGDTSLQIETSAVTVKNCTVQDSGNSAILLNAAGIAPTLDTVTVLNATNAAIRQTTAEMRANYKNLSFSGNGINGIAVNGSAIASVGLFDGSLAGQPFVVDGAVTVNAGKVLTITPGTTLRFSIGTWIDNYGSLGAVGTGGAPIVFTSNAASPQKGDWYYLRFLAGSAGNLEHCTIRYGGRFGDTSLQIETSAVTVKNCTVQDSGNSAILLNAPGIAPTLDTVTVQNATNAAIRQTTVDMKAIYKNLTLSGNGINGIAVNGSSVTTAGLFDGTLAGQPFVVDGAITVNASKALTITPGTTVRFSLGTWIDTYGTLRAIGTSGSPIAFTSNAASPQRGDWYYLRFHPGSSGRLEQCSIRYGGRFGDTSLQIESSAVSVKSCSVLDSGNSAILLNASNITPTLEAVNIQNAANAAIRQTTAQMQPIYKNLTFTGNGINGIAVNGSTVDATSQLDGALAGQPFVIDGAIAVNPGRVLTVTAGTDVRFATGAWIDVYGTLRANGTVGQPIRFRSANAPAQPGDWYYLRFFPSAIGTLEHCELSHGGRFGGAMLAIESSSVSVLDCSLTGSAGQAIAVTAAQPTIVANAIYSNVTGLRNNTVGTVVNARNNWWGSVAGPKHATNPTGTGDPISDGVLFDPWLRAVPNGSILFSPTSAGDLGPATMFLFGPTEAMTTGLSVALQRTGQPSLPGTLTFPSKYAGRGAEAVFNLTGKPRGAWDVVVIAPGGTTTVFPGAFSVIAGVAPNLSFDIVGRSAMRVGRQQAFTVVGTNSGNNDSAGAVVQIAGLPKDAQFVLGPDFNLPRPPGDDAYALPYTVGLTESAISLYLPPLPAGASVFATLAFTAPTLADFEMRLYAMAQNGASPVLSATVASVALAPTVNEQTPRSRYDAVDGAALAVLLQLARDRFAEDRVTNRVPKGQACVDATEDRNTAIRNLANQPGSPLKGWMIVGAEVGGEYAYWPLAHTLTIVKSPHSGRYYAIDNYWFPTFIPMDFISGEFFIYPEWAALYLDYTTIHLTAADQGYRPSGPFSTLQTTPRRFCSNPNPKPLTRKPVRVVTSFDPNEKSGDQGAGDAHYIAGTGTLPYTILFENKASASAPAATVLITDQLNTAVFDLSTFSLGAIGFGQTTVIPPAGLSSFARDVDLRPARNAIVRIEASLNPVSGLVTWLFTTIDPATGIETDDPFGGFLPPNVTSPEGEGRVLFTIRPKPGLANGTILTNRATIIFDANPAIITNDWSNTIDAAPPTSAVQALSPSQSTSTFDVRWSGNDPVSGVLEYTIYVSVDGGPYQAWQIATSATSATFSGERGRRYRFFSVARDQALNDEALKSTQEAETVVGGGGVLTLPAVVKQRTS